MVEGCGSKEYAKVKKFAYGDPEGFSALIDLLVRVTADYLNMQIEAGPRPCPGVRQLGRCPAGAGSAAG